MGDLDLGQGQQEKRKDAAKYSKGAEAITVDSKSATTIVHVDTGVGVEFYEDHFTSLQLWSGSIEREVWVE